MSRDPRYAVPTADSELPRGPSPSLNPKSWGLRRRSRAARQVGDRSHMSAADRPHSEDCRCHRDQCAGSASRHRPGIIAARSWLQYPADPTVRGYPCAAGRLLRGCTPVCNDHFQCLLKPQKSAILNPWDSVTDYMGWGNAGGAHSASGIDANPKLKQRAGAGLSQRLKAGVARFLPDAVVARRARPLKRASMAWRPPCQRPILAILY